MTEMTYLEAEMLSVGFLANFLWINHLFTIQTANPPRIVKTKPTCIIGHVLTNDSLPLLKWDLERLSVTKFKILTNAVYPMVF